MTDEKKPDLLTAAINGDMTARAHIEKRCEELGIAVDWDEAGANRVDLSYEVITENRHEGFGETMTSTEGIYPKGVNWAERMGTEDGNH